MIVVTKLKATIESEGEVALAKRELARLCGDVAVQENTQEDGRFLRAVVGMAAKTTLLDRLAYAEWYTVDGGEPVVPQQAAIEEAASCAFRKAGLDGTSRRQREYLGHGIHKYKAKFFPRFARSLINITCPEQAGVVLDPFGGSGTTALEAGLMGLESISNDIDPLSSLISKAKVGFITLPVRAFDEVEFALGAARRNGSSIQPFKWGETETAQYRIPDFLRIKLEAGIIEVIEEDASAIVAHVASLPDRCARELGAMMLSHALSTKLSLRWVGTGDNRFALEVTQRDLNSLARSHLKRLRANHRATCSLQLAGRAMEALQGVKVLNRSADALGIPSESVDAVVTSPPYLPASSGRETYLRSRAPGIVALHLLDEQAIKELDATRMIGSVLRRPDDRPRAPVLPSPVLDLVEWMRPQRARAPKAEPTIEYFHDLYRVGVELSRVLRPGGVVAMVVATAHTFYELTTRQIVRRFPFADVLAEYFTEPQYGIGLNLVECFELELPKQDYMARPASQHTYSETAIIFRK